MASEDMNSMDFFNVELVTMNCLFKEKSFIAKTAAESFLGDFFNIRLPPALNNTLWL